MKKNDELKLLSDDELLVRLSNVLQDSRHVESVLVAHIAEVDARRLYAREASSSMFQYCVDVLHLSEAEAYLWIRAARASRKHPVLLMMLEDGRLHLSGIAELVPILPMPIATSSWLEPPTRPSARSWCCWPRSRQSRMSRLPSGRFRSDETATSSKRRKSAVRTLQGRPVRRAAKPLRPDKVVRTLQPALLPRHLTNGRRSSRCRRRVTEYSSRRVPSSTTSSNNSRRFMPGTDLASMIEAAVSEKLERLEAKRLGKVKRPRKSLDDADTSPGVRGISAPVRRFVWERDAGQCTFEAADGRRCPERHGLHFHHDEPFGVGGDRSANNIRLACAAHNAYMAEINYGKQKMDQYRRSADRVREPEPSFQLCPDTVH